MAAKMAAKTGSSYNFSCRIDINVIPTAKVGFPGTANALAANQKLLGVVPTPANYKWRPKPEVVITSVVALLSMRFQGLK
jgi:hypothetical protein